jgi:hypothetical protein
MARKPATIAEDTQATEVVVQEQVVEEVRTPSAQTLAEMEAGRASLAARAASEKAEMKD